MNPSSERVYSVIKKPAKNHLKNDFSRFYHFPEQKKEKLIIYQDAATG